MVREVPGPSFPPSDRLRVCPGLDPGAGRPAAGRESCDFRLDVQSESHWVPAFAGTTSIRLSAQMRILLAYVLASRSRRRRLAAK
jgi:hypothetical protein